MSIPAASPRESYKQQQYSLFYIAEYSFCYVANHTNSSRTTRKLLRSKWVMSHMNESRFIFLYLQHCLANSMSCSLEGVLSSIGIWYIFSNVSSIAIHKESACECVWYICVCLVHMCVCDKACVCITCVCVWYICVSMCVWDICMSHTYVCVWHICVCLIHMCVSYTYVCVWYVCVSMCVSGTYVCKIHVCVYDTYMSTASVSIMSPTERWGAGVENHFQEFNEPYAPS